MVFNLNGFIGILFFIGAVWIGILTVVIVRMFRHYNRLTGTTTKAGLMSILESVLDMQSRIQKEFVRQGDEIGKLRNDGLLHIQRLGIVRFNPFSDTGGSQSFTVSLLDGQDNGVVMTSLYARTGNRWYIKNVRAGKGVGVELSKEEQEAIHMARHVSTKGKLL